MSGSSQFLSVKLSSQPIDNITITISTSCMDPRFLMSPSMLAFNGLNWNSPQSVTLLNSQDKISQGLSDVLCPVALAVTSSNGGAFNGTGGSVNVALKNDDVAGVTISPTTSVSLNSFSRTTNINAVLKRYTPFFKI